MLGNKQPIVFFSGFEYLWQIYFKTLHDESKLCKEDCITGRIFELISNFI
jgi:hypothetical protein